MWIAFFFHFVLRQTWFPSGTWHVYFLPGGRVVTLFSPVGFRATLALARKKATFFVSPGRFRSIAQAQVRLHNNSSCQPNAIKLLLQFMLRPLTRDGVIQHPLQKPCKTTLVVVCRTPPRKHMPRSPRENKFTRNYRGTVVSCNTFPRESWTEM